MKKILLTGAHGFLGTALRRELRDQGFHVKTLARSRSKLDNTAPDFWGDISDRETWKKIDFKADAVIHAAAALPASNAFEKPYVENLLQSQFWGTYHLCEWIAAEESVVSVLNISSLAVVGKPWPQPLSENVAIAPNGPHALYGLSKLAQEVLISSFPFGRTLTLGHARLSSLFGDGMPWSGVLCRLVDQVLDGKNPELTNGESVFADFLYHRDAARFVVTLLKNQADGIFNVASGSEISLRELAARILKVSRKTNLEILNRELGLPKQRAAVCIEKLKALDSALAFTAFDEALEATINWRLLTR